MVSDDKAKPTETAFETAAKPSRNQPKPPTPVSGPPTYYLKRDANFRPTYPPILEWKSREIADRFSAAIGLILERCPDALDGVGGEQK
jgi:hypothetical protein